MSWILTWFSHSFKDLNKVQRVFDYLLCSEPQAVAYLCAAFILTTKQQLQKFIQENEEDDDVESLFSFYADENLNKIEIDFDMWFAKCKDLEKKYRFGRIRKEYKLPKDSNLFENEFAKQLKYRKGIKKNAILESIYDVKDAINNITIKSLAIGIAGSALIYYAARYVNQNYFSAAIQQQQQ